VDGVLDRVAAEYAETLAPAIERVWQDEVGELRRDLGIWVQKLADDQVWQPAYFEFSFGLNDEGRDPRSVPDPIVVDGRFVLRGSVESGEFSVFCYRDGKLLGVESVNRPADHAHARRLLAAGRQVTPEQAADDGFDLRAAASARSG